MSPSASNPLGQEEALGRAKTTLQQPRPPKYLENISLNQSLSSVLYNSKIDRKPYEYVAKRPGRAEPPSQSQQSYDSRSEVLHANNVEPISMGRRSSSQASMIDEPDIVDCNSDPELLLQPEGRPISPEQLVIEVKEIYAGLVMVEAKCIDIDKKQSAAVEATADASQGQAKLTPSQWQALIALHKTLLHEHHDFFLANQHPSASLALNGLAANHSMPARMRRHGINAFLECLRQSIGNRFMRKTSKIKRGLASFVNGARLSVIADTGATQNVISAAYVEERKITMEETSYSFKLGNFERDQIDGYSHG